MPEIDILNDDNAKRLGLFKLQTYYVSSRESYFQR